jgi:replicative DNA helicase
MILSCLLINSDAIEVTIRNIPIDAFIFKTIKKFIGLLFSCIEIKLYRYTYFNYVLQDNGLLQKIGGVKVLIELISQIPI